MLSNTKMFWTVHNNNEVVNLYLQFDILRFNISHINFLNADDTLLLLDHENIDEEILKQLEQINSISLNHFYDDKCLNIDVFTKLHLLFPDLSKIIIEYHLEYAIEILEQIRDNKYDIAVDINTGEGNSELMVDINRYQTYDDHLAEYVHKQQNKLHSIAFKPRGELNFRYFSFESAIVYFSISEKTIFGK